MTRPLSYALLSHKSEFVEALHWRFTYQLQCHGRSFLGDIRVPAELSAYLGCHSPSVQSRAHQCATFRVAKPYDSTSAPRHGADTRQKGALCAFPPARNGVYIWPQGRVLAIFSQNTSLILLRLEFFQWPRHVFFPSFEETRPWFALM